MSKGDSTFLMTPAFRIYECRFEKGYWVCCGEVFGSDPQGPNPPQTLHYDRTEYIYDRPEQPTSDPNLWLLIYRNRGCVIEAPGYEPVTDTV